jgi:hypothetical protein
LLFVICYSLFVIHYFFKAARVSAAAMSLISWI